MRFVPKEGVRIIAVKGLYAGSIWESRIGATELSLRLANVLRFGHECNFILSRFVRNTF